MTIEVRDNAGPINPFASTVDGVYRDAVVEVRALGSVRPRRVLHMVRTEHFDVVRVGARIQVGHTLGTQAVDDDLAGLLAGELFGPGWLRGAQLFQRIFTGVVLTSAADPLSSWELFYRNTMRRIEECLLATRRGEAAGHGAIADYAPVYAHAEALTADGPVLELGCCFGFLSLRLAAAGRQVTASDASPGVIHLLTALARRLGVALQAMHADATRFPRDSACADTVLAVHLVEHLDPADGNRVIAEATRLARSRVVIAVPLEEEADETWGHVRTVSLADLHHWGLATGLPFDVHEFHGGWLVIETATRPLR
ncbi:MAG: class I SAM-dependent methyltransferase [Kineosporiaceae bacterium]|nr:class I SAM-dependent methyltransferase [Kineosporiaceae bacterium]